MLVWIGYIFLLLGLTCILHSYIFYPAIMRMLGSIRKDSFQGSQSYKPKVWILMSAFNEESVIEAKLKSYENLSYPSDKLQFWIGSDGSTDSTDQIIQSSKVPGLAFFRFEDRAGKANVLNRLLTELRMHPDFNSDTDILILTDANVLFTKALVEELVKPFERPEVGQVGAVIKNYGEDRKGISYQEKFYIGSENKLKINEGKVWGTMMGAFGACYAIRASLFPKLRKTFLMEDFFVSMYVLSEGYKAVMADRAICEEDLPSEVKEEFKRKTRISAGNFQNLSVYYPLLWPPGPIAFSFLSHKVLRWLGPLWIVCIFLGFVLLTASSKMWFWGLFVMISITLSPIFDRVLKKFGLNLMAFRYPAYFIEMNLALLKGFFLYLKGVQSNAWQPTKRNS